MPLPARITNLLNIQIKEMLANKWFIIVKNRPDYEGKHLKVCGYRFLKEISEQEHKRYRMTTNFRTKLLPQIDPAIRYMVPKEEIYVGEVWYIRMRQTNVTLAHIDYLNQFFIKEDRVPEGKSLEVAEAMADILLRGVKLAGYDNFRQFLKEEYCPRI